ncbi:MAG: carboxymuconolactone decarboxylase family protein [Rhodospirillales bacterium]
MARLPYLDVTDLAEADRDVLDRPANIYRAMANSPGGTRAFLGLAYYIRFDSPLDARLRELAILQVGYLTRSSYEWSHHLKISQEFGVSENDIRSLMAENEGQVSGLCELEKTILLAAREMTDGVSVSAGTFTMLQKYLKNSELMDLLLVISFYNGVVRFLASAEIDVESEYQSYLDTFPLPSG